MTRHKYQPSEKLQEALAADRIPVVIIATVGIYNEGETVGLPALQSHSLVSKQIARYHAEYIEYLESLRTDGQIGTGLLDSGSPHQFGVPLSTPGAHNGNAKGQAAAITRVRDAAPRSLAAAVAGADADELDGTAVRKLAATLSGRKYQDLSVVAARDIVRTESAKRLQDENQKLLDAAAGEGGDGADEQQNANTAADAAAARAAAGDRTDPANVAGRAST